MLANSQMASLKNTVMEKNDETLCSKLQEKQLLFSLNFCLKGFRQRICGWVSHSWMEFILQISMEVELLFRFLYHTDVDKWAAATSVPFPSMCIKLSALRRQKIKMRPMFMYSEKTKGMTKPPDVLVELNAKCYSLVIKDQSSSLC